MGYFKKHPLAAFILVSLLSLTAVFPVYANSLDDMRRERENIDQKIEETQRNIQEQRNREAVLQEELDQLDRRLSELEAAKLRLTAEIGNIQNQIYVTEGELAEAEEELVDQEDLFNRRLRAMYEQGTATYMEVLFSASSFGEFLTRLNNLIIIAENDLQLLEEIQARRDEIKEKKEELESKRNELEGKRRQVLNNEIELERTAVSRQRVLEDLQGEIARNLTTINNLEQAAEAIEQEIRELLRGSGGSNGITGPLHWPMEAPNVVTSEFGWRSDPFTRANAWHGGLDIAPYYGSANYILAAADGEVIFSGIQTTGGTVNLSPGYDAGRPNLIGYGSYIMIDHGNGSVTLYGHMSRRTAAVGDTVIRGQRIGRAGTTGYSTGVHLHFEVREYEQAPYRYYPSGAPDYRHNPRSYF